VAGEIKLNLVSAFNDKGVKDAMGKLKGLGDGVRNLTKQLVGGYVGWQGLQKGIAFISSSVDAARDLERNLSGLSTIFGEATAEMTDFSKAGVEMGMSTAEAAKATTFIGSVMKQSGFAMADNTVLTKELVGLGADLAATYGYDVQEALTGMTALFRGEYDPIEKFGVAIKQAQVNAEMASLGLDKLTGQEKLHAQQLVRMKLLFAATSDAQGAFARNGDTLFVSQARLAATWTNMKATVAESLIGPLAAVVQLMEGIVSNVGPSLTKLFGALGGLVMVVGENATAASKNINGLIDQFTNLISFATPIIGWLISLFSNFGSEIIIFVATFKTVSTIVTKVGIAVTSLRTILLSFTAAQAAATAGTAALASAQGGLAAATAATPWGAIAVVLGLVVAGTVAWGAASRAAWPPVVGLARETKVLGNNMYGTAAAAKTMHEQISSGGSNMADLSTMNVQVGLSSAVATSGVVAYTGSLKQQAAAITVARKEDEFYVKGAKKVAEANMLKAASALPATESPEDLVKKQIAAFKKMMNAFSVTAGTGTGAAKAAKAMVDPFKTAVNKIKDELTGLHDSLMGAFDITSMGKSGSTIARNMAKLMTKMREFTGLIRQLKDKGLNADLLQQIVKAGPVEGLDAARALVGSSSLMNEANQSYSEFGALANQVAADTVQAKYQNQYNITVEGGVGSGATIGKAVVAAIQAYERQSGNTWRA